MPPINPLLLHIYALKFALAVEQYQRGLKYVERERY